MVSRGTLTDEQLDNIEREAMATWRGEPVVELVRDYRRLDAEYDAMVTVWEITLGKSPARQGQPGEASGLVAPLDLHSGLDR